MDHHPFTIALMSELIVVIAIIVGAAIVTRSGALDAAITAWGVF